jgi:hypothetical protein
MKKLAIENVRISYVEDLLIKDVVDSRILCVNNLEESISNIDVLVVNKILKNHLKTSKVLEQLQRDDLWILDPSRILLEVNSDLIERSRYLTVGKGI